VRLLVPKQEEDIVTGEYDMTINSDGGSRGNPGPAGYGAVVRSRDGTVLAEVKGGIGWATNNVAEYRGVIAGLEKALELGARRVLVRADSKLVIEQSAGRWRVHHPDMIQLHGRVRELVQKFDTVVFRHVHREENTHADRLANEAMDEQGEVPAP